MNASRRKYYFIFIIVLVSGIIILFLKQAKRIEEKDRSTMIVKYVLPNPSSGAPAEQETCWFVMDGKKDATLSLKENQGEKDSIRETLVVRDDKWVYTVDLLKKSGTKMNMKNMDYTSMVLGSKMNIRIKDLRAFIKNNGGKMIGSDTVLGKKCEVFELFGIREWVYKGIVLKASHENLVFKEAVKIDENVQVPSGKFQISEETKIIEIPGFEAMVDKA